ncbi:unnamed protein product [Ilex paraguariensis]|uniref:Pre-mRNA-processing factor 39 n=1 Tax=Ilex paraguariensis TaxID=185542 RepID=A0ABC8SYJ3_9AQUA
MHQVVKLYERCLIACANYPEYWIRYILCMEATGSMDLADNALTRATQVFVKKSPEIHLFAARFRDQHGDIPGARTAYQLLHTEISPGLLEAIIKHANMEHRLGNLEDACCLYKQAIAIEKGKEYSPTLPLLFAQYSRFLYLDCPCYSDDYVPYLLSQVNAIMAELSRLLGSGKVEKAREILEQALEIVQFSKLLLEALIHLESIQSHPKRIDYIDTLVERFIVPNIDYPNAASITEKEDLSSIFLEFLDLFGDAQSIKKAGDRHTKLFLHHKSTSESKKRHAEDFLASDNSKLPKSVDATSAPSVMGVYPNAPNQWPAGYGLQPQAWPQGQQWNPSYTQQQVMVYNLKLGPKDSNGIPAIPNSRYFVFR